jgi:hypothetical protein
MSQWLNPRTVRPASGERLRVERTREGVGLMWEKQRWSLWEIGSGSEFGSFKSSDERVSEMGSGSCGVDEEVLLEAEEEEEEEKVLERVRQGVKCG